jgi:hypothetical protein
VSESTSRLLSEAILAAGGTVATLPVSRARVPQPVDAPFASADLIEDTVVHAIDVGPALDTPPVAAFLDGIQRYGVAGRLGLVPVVRAHVAAAALARLDGDLIARELAEEEFVVAPLDRLPGVALRHLEEVGVPLLNSAAGDRPHPIVDVYLAARIVESRREAVELEVGRRYLESSGQGWLVVDGSLSGYDESDDVSRLLGVVKSHETQFLDGADLGTALTLPSGFRTTVFARRVGGRRRVYTWYLRLWPSEGHDLLYGLVRLERPAFDSVLEEVDDLSRWILSERAPLSAPDERWDRLLYPIRQVEEYLRARAGGWA